MSLHEVHCLIRAEEGVMGADQQEFLTPAIDDDIILRLLNDMKAAALIQESSNYELGFELCNILIEWQGRHPHWIRERAFLAQKLGCVSFASSELEILIEEEPDDPLVRSSQAAPK